MSRGVHWMTVLAAAALGASCTPDRVRPFEDPTSPVGGGGSSPRSSSAKVDIVAPADGDTILRETFTEGSGREVIFRGEFVAGQTLVMEGFANRYGPIPFYTEDHPIEQGGSQEIARFFQAQVRHLEESDEALLVGRVRDGSGALITGDSIRVKLR